jgi:serine/threonine protein kinase
MKPIEIYQQRREIDVLKMCQHPNIVGMIDLFENSDYYYIVLEYMQGKDLFDYIQFRNFKLSEQRVKEISYQLGLAIKYLHSYGIVHRDIKLENVMMSDNTEASVPKLVDFGLAKMIGPNEKADEPFGTLGYVAPEVLKKEPYSYSCDLWSYGCIMYALLSGSLPFDHESQKETIKMTLENKLEFDLPCWKNVSEPCKELIISLLEKDPKNRINLEKSLSHPWFESIDINHKTGVV